MSQQTGEATPDLEPGTAGKRPSRRKWFFITGILLLLAGAGLYTLYWVVTGRIATVHEGVLYRSAELPPEKLTELCREYGIKTVMDFRKEGPKTEAESRALNEIGVSYVHLPTEQLPGPGVLENFLAVMAQEENRPVLIHCQHGVGRTGLHAAVYRIEFQDWSNEHARWEAMILSGFDSFQKDTYKGQFVEEYIPDSDRKPESP